MTGGGLPEEAMAMLPEQGTAPQAIPQEAPQGVPQVPTQSGGLPQQAVSEEQAAQAKQGQGYNGVVEAFGQQVEVVDGMAEFNGEQFFVSVDGSWVVNQEQQVIGYIDNGKFVEADDAYLEELRAKGMLEEGA